VDRPHEQGAELIEDLWADNFSGPLRYPVSELSRSALGEGESHDARGRLTGSEKTRDALRNDLGFARSGAGDDLQVAASVLYGIEGFTLKLRCGHGPTSGRADGKG
jgi:hypothetical protein